MLGQRLIVLRNLIALGQIGIKIILARESRECVDAAMHRERGLYRHLDRLPVEHRQRARHPRQTGQTLVLGGAPKPVGQPQNIFVRVLS